MPELAVLTSSISLPGSAVGLTQVLGYLQKSVMILSVGDVVPETVTSSPTSACMAEMADCVSAVPTTKTGSPARPSAWQISGRMEPSTVPASASSGSFPISTPIRSHSSCDQQPLTASYRALCIACARSQTARPVNT